MRVLPFFIKRSCSLFKGNCECICCICYTKSHGTCPSSVCFSMACCLSIFCGIDNELNISLLEPTDIFTLMMCVFNESHLSKLIN